MAFSSRLPSFKLIQTRYLYQNKLIEVRRKGENKTVQQIFIIHVIPSILKILKRSTASDLVVFDCHLHKK